MAFYITQDEKPKAKSETKIPSPKKRTPSGKRKSKGGEEGDEDEEDDEDIIGNDIELPCIAICHSLNNEREMHMTGSPDDMKVCRVFSSSFFMIYSRLSLAQKLKTTW